MNWSDIALGFGLGVCIWANIWVFFKMACDAWVKAQKKNRENIKREQDHEQWIKDVASATFHRLNE